jgi:hypothetical protein
MDALLLSLDIPICGKPLTIRSWLFSKIRKRTLIQRPTGSNGRTATVDDLGECGQLRSQRIALHSGR